MRYKEGSMEDKLKAAIAAYAEAQSKVLERVFVTSAAGGHWIVLAGAIRVTNVLPYGRFRG